MDLIQSYDEDDDSQSELKENLIIPDVGEEENESGNHNNILVPYYLKNQDENKENERKDVQKYFFDDFTFNQSYYKGLKERKRKVKRIIGDTDNILEIISDGNDEYSLFPKEAFVVQEKVEEDEEDAIAEPKQKRRKLMESSFHLKKRSNNLLEPKDSMYFTNTKTRLPKKLDFDFPHAHDKGINRILFFPKYGHFLLSCSVDGTIKLWDVENRKKLVQTYFGYGDNVFNLDFDEDGKQFLSCHRNGTVKLWDTEYGKIISSFECENDQTATATSEESTSSEENKSKKKRRNFPVVAKHNVKNSFEFLAGYKNNHILQWDKRKDSSKPVKSYEQHVKSITDILFIEDGAKFVSSSYDKTLRIWEYGNNEDTIKFINENYIKTVLKLSLNPNNKEFFCQSITNSIFSFKIEENYPFVRNKKFTGHKITKYPVNFGMSNDSKWLYSGDSTGTIWIWRTDQDDVVEKLKGYHTNVVMDCAWHPYHRSRFSSAGWDQRICIFK